MTVNYTTNLALGQPVTGTESGTWGDDVNNSVTSYLDIAIAGGLAITITTTDVTLSLTQGTSSATNIGSTTAQYAILNISGAMTAARNLILPSSSRQYVINNNTTGGFALTVKGAATTGVTMVNGESAHIYWNGSDYAKLSNAPGGAGTFTNLTYTGTLTGSTGVIAIGTNQIYKDSSGNVGIGTTSPAQKLDVVGSGKATSSFAVGDSSGNLSGSMVNESDVSKSITFNADPANVGTNSFMRWNVDGTERMRIDSSGNVGVGTSAPVGKLDVQSASASIFVTSTTGTNSVAFRANNTGGYMIVGRDSSTGGNYGAAYASVVWSNGAYPMLFATNDIERMRIDSSGNVGIGTSLPAQKLQVTGKAIVGSYANTGAYGLYLRSDALSTHYNWQISTQNTIDGGFEIARSNAVGSSTFNSPSLVIDSSGNLLVGTTTTGVTGVGIKFQTTNSVVLAVSANTTNATDTYNMYSTGAGAYRFYVDWAGTIHATSTVITAISDQRLKENVRDIDTGLDAVMLLKPRRFDWKEGKGQDKKNVAGFIAQEFEQIFPESVGVSKAGEDGIEYKNINYETLIPTLVKAIQELKTLVDTQASTITSLTARIEALEST